MTITEYSQEQLAAQPIGYWSGVANEIVVGCIRAALAEEGLTQPHWWILNHLAGAPEQWTRVSLTAKLSPFDRQDTDFEAVYADLVSRGWIAEFNGRLTLTDAGEGGRQRAKARTLKVHEQMHNGVETADYVTTLNVLRRMIANLGGNSDLP
ncbi:MarR family transcriptional regulator [Streptomyces sp. HB2AG]|uniref:MarR family transcriptional regulator n=1 Tax=Streptomyces sp. HB2AG TaxID=2983400 RepID=UPI0022AB3DD9|nr:MarR family transcriptional regulator [Streptomyces sp. HB2AG]MCZ2525763.1 MarR family transcriptional regulator [Streptomyces sp. HB2AG]